MTNLQPNQTTPSNPTVTSRTAADFLRLELPPKQPIISGICYRRDIIALGGRRRHGKTNFCLNLGVGLTHPWPDFVGYEIERPFRVLEVLLEDDATEVQDKLRKVLNVDPPSERLAIMTRNDFLDANVPIHIQSKQFGQAIMLACETHKPDLIVLDNLSQLVAADYNNSVLIHEVTQLAHKLTNCFDAAVLIPAHPRKRSNDASGKTLQGTLKEDPEGFFENIMGSSHFINSCGSHWGIERDLETDQTVFLGGAQRLTGQQSVATLEIGEDHRLRVVHDYGENLKLACNTLKRKEAWDLLPSGPFTYMEGFNSVKAVMKSESTYNAWWREYLIRLGLLTPTGSGKYMKVTRIENKHATDLPRFVDINDPRLGHQPLAA
jgi:AAA domain